MKVTAWNNGDYNRTGAGYGLRLDPIDRDRAFDRSWREVLVDLPNGVSGSRVRIAASFWQDCPELRSKHIGEWLIGAGPARWPRGAPPAFTLSQVQDSRFRVT